MKKEERTDNMDDLEEALEADLSRVSSTMSNQDQGELMNIIIASDYADDGCIVEVRSVENVAESTRKALDLSETREFVVLMGEDELDLEESFEANGVADGARLMVDVGKVRVEDFIHDLKQANPHMEGFLDMSQVLTYKEQEHPDSQNDSDSDDDDDLGDVPMGGLVEVNLCGLEINVIPPCIGNLDLEHVYLDLADNHIETLPESIGGLKCDSLMLAHNALDSLPPQFMEAEINEIHLSQNRFRSLDDVFNLKLERPGRWRLDPRIRKIMGKKVDFLRLHGNPWETAFTQEEIEAYGDIGIYFIADSDDDDDDDDDDGPGVEQLQGAMEEAYGDDLIVQWWR